MDREKELEAVFKDGINAIRWLLNHAKHNPKKWVGGLMDCFTIENNHTSKTSETLERLWENGEAILTSMQAPQYDAPEGYVLVPIEPTWDMVLAADGLNQANVLPSTYKKRVYKAMISASPIRSAKGEG